MISYMRYESFPKVAHMRKIYVWWGVKKSRDIVYMTLVQDPNMKHIGKSYMEGSG